MKKIFILSFLVSLIGLMGACTDDDKYDYGWEPGYPDPGGNSGDDGYDGNKFAEYGENPFVDASENPKSTFSVDADGASYAVMRSYISNGRGVPFASVRIEEYLNYFTFDYPEPEANENVSVCSEITSCPWDTDHLLMRIGLKGKTIPDDQLPPSNYVFLIDVSGSMTGSDRIDLAKEGFRSLVEELSEADRVAIVTYAGNSGVTLPSTSCEDKSTILDAINSLRAGGSTNGQAGIQTAYAIAEENFIPGGNNRIILASDGDFNVGITSTSDLIEYIEGKRNKGIYLTVLGFGTGNLNDEMMEQLADSGNGTYEYIDKHSQMMKVFVHERSKLYSVATDCKIQVTFNEQTVDRYRLIGYENRTMADKDFEDDEKDAGEIGAGQTITALYEIIPHSNSRGKYAGIDIRYKKADNETSRLIKADVYGDPVNISESSENMRFAAAVTAFGLTMKDSKYKGSASASMAVSLAENSLGEDRFGYRREFLELAGKAATQR